MDFKEIMEFFERLLDRLLEWLPLDWLPLASPIPRSQMLVVGLIIMAGLVILVLFRLRKPRGGSAHGAWIEGIEERVAVKAQPLMNGAEISVFNLLLLAVRDHFLLLAKVPLRNLVQLRVDDDFAKRVVAQALRNVTVDFVLVHPGTRLPVKAVFLEKPDDDVTASHTQEWLVEVLFQKAGIEVILLDQEARYSVERLINLLGLDEEA